MKLENLYPILRKYAAQMYGFKTVSAAKKDGINLFISSIEVSELAEILKVTTDEVRRYIYDWKATKKISHTSHVNDTIYFLERY